VEPLALPVTTETLWTASKLALGFLAVMFVAARFLPGIERVGYPQPDGTRKRYTLSGMPTFLLSNMVLAAVVVAKALGWSVSLTPIAQHFWSLLIVALALSTLITLALLAWGRRAGPVCRSPESTDLPIPAWMKTFWFGNECNPELFGVDLKMFFYQPSLIGAYLVNVSFAFAQWERHGFVTPQMLCLCFFWFTYLFTHYVKEEFMLSTWDVMAENFGFMLVWGDLTYVPFLYSLPGWWMVDDTAPFSTFALVLLLAFHFAALTIFRQSNWQKERFKQDPTAPIWGRPPRLVGGRLLASGYWGIGRKVNYTGEILVYASFAACAGFEAFGPWVLPLALLGLLVHRAHRDDKRCRAKYGALWSEYGKIARWRVIPFVY
jgi:delta14-sterol reductase